MELNVLGGIVQVDSEGQGPEIVMVHSLLTDAAAFDQVASALAAGHTVHRISLPGFGSTTPLAKPSIEDLADLVAATADALQCEPDTVVYGNGLGGFVAVAAAARHSQRFGGLIATNCGSVFPADRTPAFETMATLAEADGMKAVVDVAVRRIFTETYLEDHPEVIGERRDVILAVEPDAFAAACRALAKMDLRPILSNLAMPVLVVAGGADQTTPPEMSEQLAAEIEGSELAVIDNCGHCPQLERPQALLAAVAPFLGRAAA